MQLPEIQPVDSQYYEKARSRWDNLIKPRSSLGILEDIVCRLCAIAQTDPPDVRSKRLIVFAGDHGIVEEKVSAYPQEVTLQMVRGFLSGRAAICILARAGKIDLKVVDAGMAARMNHPNLVAVHIADGTKNFVKQPAMSTAQMQAALTAGIDFAMQAKADGVGLLAGGDMGIGNSTSAAAIYSALFNVDAATVTGHGAGLDPGGWKRKVAVINAAVNKWKIPADQPLEVLRHFGGFEIALLAGLYLGAGAARIPAVVDGYIATAASALAMAARPLVRDYLFFAHSSAEQGFDSVRDKLLVQPLLHLGMRLGEGTGAALAMQIIENAVRLYEEMPTFAEAEVSRNHS